MLQNSFSLLFFPKFPSAQESKINCWVCLHFEKKLLQFKNAPMSSIWHFFEIFDFKDSRLTRKTNAKKKSTSKTKQNVWNFWQKIEILRFWFDIGPEKWRIERWKMPKQLKEQIHSIWLRRLFGLVFTIVNIGRKNASLWHVS